MKIMLQGAVERELAYFMRYFENLKKVEKCGFEFYECDFRGHKIIISNTNIGIMNATMSTTIAAEFFKPDIIINQGSCGGHTLDMTKGKLLICDSAVYINNIIAPIKGEGEGSNSLDWTFGKRSIVVPASDELVRLSKDVPFNGEKVYGAIGSGDLFSREYDRIVFINKNLGELAEDMETVASFEVAEKFNIKHIAFRIVANNEMLLDPMDKKSGVLEEKLQRFVIDFVLLLISKDTEGK